MVGKPNESVVSHRFFRARTAEALGRALKQVRAEHDMTQGELAHAIESSRPTISRMERGSSVASDVVLAALARCGYELVVVPRGAVISVRP
jgi:DNA-binding XRE family transcriptional regulator